MLPSHTTLKRREPKGDHLDELRVIGISPIKDTTVADWVGSSGGEAYIVQPSKEFGSAEVMPYAVISAEYDILEPPVEPPVIEAQRPQIMRALTPEEVFAQEAKAAKKKPPTKPAAKA